MNKLSISSRARIAFRAMVSPNAVTIFKDLIPGRKDPTPKNLSSYIAPVQLDRFRQDVQTWREGVKEAENAWYPQRVKMQRLYLDTVLNGHVKSCLKKRRDLTLLREFRFVDKSGNINEQWTKLFRAKWFEDFLTHAINARFFGYSLIQIGDIINGIPQDMNVVRRHNISPDRMNVTQYVYSISGVPFTKDPYNQWCVWVPTINEAGISNCGYGELYEVGIYEIFLRNLLGFNGDYVEVFGQPFRVGKTNKSQEDPERMLFEQMLKSMGSNGYAVMDHDDTVDLIETKNSPGKDNPFANLEARCEKKISKILLGHSDAMDSTPGRLGSDQGGEESQVQKALDAVQVNDGRFVCNVVENELLPKLRALGMRVPEELTFEFSNDNELTEARKNEDLNNKVTAEVFQTIKNAGGDPDWKYFTERTGIPVEKAEEIVPQGMNDFPDDIKNKLEELYNH